MSSENLKNLSIKESKKLVKEGNEEYKKLRRKKRETY